MAEDQTTGDVQAAQQQQAKQRATQEAADGAVKQQAQEQEGILRRILNWIKSFFSRNSSGANQEGAAQKDKAKEQADILEGWDSLQDETSKIQQVLKQELQGLSDTKPTPPDADTPEATEAYQAELKAHDKRIEKAQQNYISTVTPLQAHRDALVKAAGISGLELNNVGELDAALGTEQEGPGHESFKAMRQEMADAIEQSQHGDGLSSPVTDIQRDNGIVHGTDSRLAIGDRLLEITQQGLASDKGIDQKALDKEFSKLMPANEEGTIGLRAQMEQKTNLAFATAMAAVVSDYVRDHQRGAIDPGAESSEDLRKQRLNSDKVLISIDTMTQNTPHNPKVDLAVDSMRIERQAESKRFDTAYAQIAKTAGFESHDLQRPEMKRMTPTEGVTMVRAHEEREAIANNVFNMVNDSIKARGIEANGNEPPSPTEVDYEAVERLLAPLTAPNEGVDLTHSDMLNQLRNRELANELLTSVQAMDQSNDTQKRMSSEVMAAMTSEPSQEEFKKHYMDDNGQVDTGHILEQSEKALDLYQTNMARRRPSRTAQLPAPS